MLFLFCRTISFLLLCSNFALSLPSPAVPISDADIIPNNYIITLKPTASLSSHVHGLSKRSRFADSVQIQSEFRIGTAFQAYTAIIKSTFDISQLTSDPDVLHVEPDRIVRLAEFDGGYEADKTVEKRALITQSPIPNWGLGRISHRAPGATKYVYDDSAGEGTFAYLLDTGVYAAHSQFAPGRASWQGYNPAGTGTVDGNGHGTAVAGIIAGTLNGVAKKANIVPVKVLDNTGAGTLSNVIAGIQWALSDATSNNRLNKSLLFCSVGGSFSAALNAAVTSVYNSGLLVVAAAGSSATDLSQVSPGSAPVVFTVASTTITDGKLSSNNYGPLLDIYGPGQSISTTWIGSPTATMTLTSTGMAAAHVAGVMLYFMRLYSTTLLTPGDVIAKVLELCTPLSSGGCIVYNGSGL